MGKSGSAADVARATDMPDVKAVVTSAALKNASTVEVAATMAVTATAVTTTAVTATAVTATAPANRGARQRRRQHSNGNRGDQL
jgi:hypothetical protein